MNFVIASSTRRFPTSKKSLWSASSIQSLVTGPFAAAASRCPMSNGTIRSRRP